tara:strand:+ start:16989 stop:17093 length:105 start_codon:yes stop_codon:yes gene_type:complete
MRKFSFTGGIDRKIEPLILSRNTIAAVASALYDA